MKLVNLTKREAAKLKFTHVFEFGPEQLEDMKRRLNAKTQRRGGAKKA